MCVQERERVSWTYGATLATDRVMLFVRMFLLSLLWHNIINTLFIRSGYAKQFGQPASPQNGCHGLIRREYHTPGLKTGSTLSSNYSTRTPTKGQRTALHYEWSKLHRKCTPEMRTPLQSEHFRSRCIL